MGFIEIDTLHLKDGLLWRFGRRFPNHGGALLPIRLWELTARWYPETGIITDDELFIETELGWDGEPGKLIAEFINLGFLHRVPDGLLVNNWPGERGDILSYWKYPWEREQIKPQIRKDVLSAKKCRNCGTKKKLTVDHIVPFSRGGTDKRTNLQCLCLPCNSRKKVTIEKYGLDRKPHCTITPSETN